jgi:hypothetical protein
MSAPRFSVAIPTKNRPESTSNAVRSVLQQTFTDLEIVVCDNSDEAEAIETARAARAFNDPRIRYVRTSGTLSMPDNWERAVAETGGEFVTILTDRSVLRRDALQRVHQAAESTGLKLFAWFPDHFGRGQSPERGRQKFGRRACSTREFTFESRRVLDYFLNGQPKCSGKVLPKLMTAACHRSVIEQIRSSRVGRVCPPVCPDYTSGFLMLAHVDRFLLFDDTFFVSCGVGNGSSFRGRGTLAHRFLQDLGMTWKQLVEFLPTEACFSHALVRNDFIRLARILPERFPAGEVNRVQYYLGCLTDYKRAAQGGADLTEDFDILIDGLNREASQVQEAVRCRDLYLRSLAVLPAARAVPQADDDEPLREDRDGDEEMFETVFDALAWAEAHPRRSDVPSMLASMPPLDELRRWDRSQRRRRMAAGGGLK